MNKRLRYIPFSDAAEGMVLGAPLTIAEHGVTNFSLPAGHVISASSLRQILQRHGEYLCIAEDDPRTEEEIREDRKTVEARVNRIFSGADLSQPNMAAFRAAVLAYRSV